MGYLSGPCCYQAMCKLIIVKSMVGITGVLDDYTHYTLVIPVITSTNNQQWSGKYVDRTISDRMKYILRPYEQTA